ncbi:hypothetical protein KL86CLO1_12511 [uncultured Eubacteriales bacterium]|uniref:Uncharacterized protein n=1 Tax=uncultured Eubacteriales bacterium TaxID=172733 RepID=A0A212KAM2_9FIRM|nr:hypothetical protein KL86CLO1_12511 [uncultured Eubacteriales bacterium]
MAPHLDAKKFIFIIRRLKVGVFILGVTCLPIHTPTSFLFIYVRYIQKRTSFSKLFYIQRAFLPVYF